MPKRSAQSKIEHYANKIRKIEEKERRRRIISPVVSSSDDEAEEGNEVALQAVSNVDAIIPDPAIPEPTLVVPDIVIDAEPESIDNPCPIEDQAGPAGPSLQDGITTNMDPNLDPELLSALGECTSETPDYGDNIHDKLSKLWLPLLKKGMTKDNKDKIIKDYLIPDNCRLLQTPKLNAEISAAVPDMVRHRDKTLSVSQQQLGSGITAINRGIDMLLQSDNKVQAIKHLSNGCRLLCDSHHSITQNRIKLITPSLDKTILHMINESERDETLFGASLSEKIKAAKAIEKQGLQIKKPTKPQKTTPPQSGARPSSYQGNWSAPPRYPVNNRGGRGGYKKPPMMPGARRPYAAPPAKQSQRAPIQDKPRAAAHNQHH